VVRNFIKYNRLFLNKRELKIIFASISWKSDWIINPQYKLVLS
jgi:hypothetical protein